MRSFGQLTRFTVSLAVTFSAVVAACVASGRWEWIYLLQGFGIFLLASGASALNQAQEHEYDARMERTAHRPVPSGKIKIRTASGVALVLLLSGLGILFFFSPLITILLGAFNILWYNGVYTYLKRVTAFAVVPGALTGAIPVLMGWTAAGGAPADPVILLIASFIFLWQVPHFWLLMLIHGEDYQLAGFPVLADLFTGWQIRSLTFAWLVASVAASVLLLRFGIIKNIIPVVSILAMDVGITVMAVYVLFISRDPRFRLLFITLNAVMLATLLLAAIDRLF